MIKGVNMNSGYKFGVCECDLDYSNKVKNLEIFEDYNSAYDCYIKTLNNSTNAPNLWLVWIRKSDNQIEQFDQLKWNTRCKLVKIY